LIGICVQDSCIAILPLDDGGLSDAVRIYNCGCDTHYATGQQGGLSVLGVSSLIERIKASDNEFLAGIYIKAPGEGTETLLRFAGLCSGILQPGALWIRQLSVLPEYRKKGIGTRTVDALLKYVKDSHDVRAVFLSVAGKNTAGLCFWRKLGFSEAHRFEKVLFSEKLPSNVIIMQKKLL
jgi:GNAT superfamily N-acetyltransferase